MKNDMGDFNRNLFRRRTNYSKQDHTKPFGFKKLIVFAVVIGLAIYFREDLSIFIKELL
jgi:hypothetical protein